MDAFKLDLVLPLSCLEDLDALLFGRVNCCFEELPLGKDLLLFGFLVLVAEVTGSMKVPSLCLCFVALSADDAFQLLLFQALQLLGHLALWVECLLLRQSLLQQVVGDLDA
jgi:hypothetical protein